MKVLIVFISVLYLVHSYSLEEEKEALESLEEIALQDAEPLLAADEVKEESRKCVHLGAECSNSCDCCGDTTYCNCPLFGLFRCSCVPSTSDVCHTKMAECAVKPKSCKVSADHRRGR
uniref:Putative neurotoxin LTDF S-08 n=1 Tax=Dolomedes fimbriatus TaxID=1432569 RepID=A0A0K1D8I4_9ARAC|nr:putative neurotoxin LTDF S-08 [Dolomedes fimbriatus]